MRTDSRSDRAAWLQALASTRRVLPLQSLSGDFSFVSPKDLSISTERLKERLREEGINENLVKECEEIVDSEFSEVQEQIKLLHEERTKLLNALKQLEVKLKLAFPLRLSFVWLSYLNVGLAHCFDYSIAPLRICFGNT